MEFFEATTTISATPEAVWAVLVDGAAWPSWDSGVESVSAPIAAGARISIVSSVVPGRAFPVKVTALAAPTRLEFTGGMPFGLFKGVRTYTLTPQGKSTEFRMREEYTGPMLGAIWKSIPDLAPSFRQFVEGLKKRVEAGV
jgi:uncharacterized protein YndB with AHSA1/START domain